MRDPAELISRHFDGLSSDDEHQELQDWLRASVSHQRDFARAAMLHDRLRGEQVAISICPAPVRSEQLVPTPKSRRHLRLFGISAGVMTAFVALVVMLLGIGRTAASAVTELNRLIAAQETGLDKTYTIAVEEVPVPRRPRRRQAEDRRPPKPPLDGAVLHVRRGNQFVLIRSFPGGQQFVTGSNGSTSWAVRPDGPVRVSNDLTRFNRDLPGHEHDIPLMQIEQSLEHLRNAYDIQLLPVETDEDATAETPPTRLLVAVKKRGFRGPQRIEITYAVQSGQIRQLRFIEMPYGPEHLTVRLTLEEERALGDSFFDHPSHHSPDRVVEQE
jgi:hypothetical protein